MNGEFPLEGKLVYSQTELLKDAVLGQVAAQAVNCIVRCLCARNCGNNMNGTAVSAISQVVK